MPHNKKYLRTSVAAIRPIRLQSLQFKFEYPIQARQLDAYKAPGSLVNGLRYLEISNVLIKLLPVTLTDVRGAIRRFSTSKTHQLSFAVWKSKTIPNFKITVINYLLN